MWERACEKEKDRVRKSNDPTVSAQGYELKAKVYKVSRGLLELYYKDFLCVLVYICVHTRVLV